MFLLSKLIGEHPKNSTSSTTQKTTQKMAALSAAAAGQGLMRAAVYDAATAEGVKVVATRPTPAPAAASLLVRVKACGINPVDAKFLMADKLPEFLHGAARRLVSGCVVGLDLSGVVEHAPPGCGFSVGDEVFGAVPPMRGSMAEVVVVPLDQVALKPAALSFAQAAALVLPGVTVLQLLQQHGFAPGQHVLVVGGSGGVGHLAVQIAKAQGAGRVAAVCSGANAEFVRGLGADDVVDYTRGGGEAGGGGGGGGGDSGGGGGSGDGDSVVHDLQEVVRAAGRPFDIVIDTVSSHDLRDSSHEYERRIRSARDPPLVASGPAADPHNYVTIGSGTAGWARAGLKRMLGVNLFARGSELFWIRFHGCAPDLETLRALADPDRSADHQADPGGSSGAPGSTGKQSRAAVCPVIEAMVPLTTEGVQEGFRRLNARRVRGKLVVQVSLH